MLAFDPLPLWHSRVFHHGLDDAHAVIFKVVVNDNRAYTVLLFRAIQDILYEVSIEAKQLRDKQAVDNRQMRF